MGYPVGIFNFVATFGHEAEIAFSKISGMSKKISYEPYSPGGMNDCPVALRTPNKEFNTLTFEKGVYKDDKSIAVFDSWVNGEKLPNQGTITIYGEKSEGEREIIRQYSFSRPIILSYELGDLDASSNTILIEKFQIIHEGLKRMS